MGFVSLYPSYALVPNNNKKEQGELAESLIRAFWNIMNWRMTPRSQVVWARFHYGSIRTMLFL